MSLLMKALKRAEQGSELTLEPMPPRTEPAAPDRAAQSAAGLMFEKQAAAERRRLMILLGVLAAVVIGMGAYFYVAIYMPWLLLPRQAAVATPPAHPAPAADPVPILPPADQAGPRDAVPTVVAAAASARPETPTPPRPESPVAAPPVAEADVAPAPKRKRRARANAAVTPADEGAVKVVPATRRGEDLLATAYALLQQGRLDEAREAYARLRATDPGNPDVLLGLAVIEQSRGRGEEAAQLYLQVLAIEPNNAFAQANLAGVMGRADPLSAETRLRGLIAQQPAAYLYFALGNVYALQGRWREAQAAYFEAQRLEPEAPDYAFNLAVSLAHLGQPRAALDYYQRALRLAQARAAAFDRTQAAARVRALSAAGDAN